MTEHKETFVEKLLKIWYSILAAFGLCTIRSRDEKEREIADLHDKYDEEIQNIIKDYEGKFAEYGRMIDDLTKRSQIAKESYNRIHDQMLRYRDTVPTENLDTIKELEKQIHDIYATSRHFSFPNSIPMAGSVSMNDSGVIADNDNFLDVKVRLIATDEETAKINQEPDQVRRYAMLVDIMKRRGLLERLGERMISSGAATIAMAYNGDCTCFECYLEATAKVLPDAGTIKTLKGDHNNGTVQQFPEAEG